MPPRQCPRAGVPPAAGRPPARPLPGDGRRTAVAGLPAVGGAVGGGVRHGVGKRRDGGDVEVTGGEHTGTRGTEGARALERVDQAGGVRRGSGQNRAGRIDHCHHAVALLTDESREHRRETRCGFDGFVERLPIVDHALRHVRRRRQRREHVRAGGVQRLQHGSEVGSRVEERPHRGANVCDAPSSRSTIRPTMAPRPSSAWEIADSATWMFWGCIRSRMSTRRV